MLQITHNVNLNKKMFAVEENFEIINSKLTDEITNQKKRAAWSKVAQKVD